MRSSAVEAQAVLRRLFCWRGVAMCSMFAELVGAIVCASVKYGALLCVVFRIAFLTWGDAANRWQANSPMSQTVCATIEIYCP